MWIGVEQCDFGLESGGLVLRPHIGGGLVGGSHCESEMHGWSSVSFGKPAKAALLHLGRVMKAGLVTLCTMGT